MFLNNFYKYCLLQTEGPCSGYGPCPIRGVQSGTYIYTYTTRLSADYHAIHVQCEYCIALDYPHFILVNLFQSMGFIARHNLLKYSCYNYYVILSFYRSIALCKLIVLSRLALPGYSSRHLSMNAKENPLLRVLAVRAVIEVVHISVIAMTDCQANNSTSG